MVAAMSQTLLRVAFRRAALQSRPHCRTRVFEVARSSIHAKRFFSDSPCYASNPQKWCRDPDVEAYGKCLAAEAEDPDAFKSAAARLRGRSDLPADLRASAGRAQARALFKEASSLCESLKIDLDQPWPESAHQEALLSVKRASDLYEKVLKESLDPELTAAVGPHCAEWPAAVVATETACKEVKKLENAVRMLEVRWLTVQIDRARAVAHADRNGDQALKAQQANKLQAVGLPEISEKDLLFRSVKVAEDIVEALRDESSEDDTKEDLKKLRATAQVLLIAQLKELALACACASEIVEAGKHVTRALSVCPDIESTLSVDAADHLKEVAQAIWEHTTRSMQLGATAKQDEEMMRFSAQMGSALMQFNARRYSNES